MALSSVWLPVLRKLRAAAVGSLVVMVHGGAVQAATPLYWCPGNLFTNELDAVRARAMACRPVVPARLSQGSAGPRSSSALVPSTAPSVANAVPGMPRPSTSQTPGVPSAAGKPERPAAALARTASATVQLQRDRDAVAILQAELARNLSAQRTQADAGGPFAAGPELHRLRRWLCLKQGALLVGLLYAITGNVKIPELSLDTDEGTAKLHRRNTCRSSSHERIED